MAASRGKHSNLYHLFQLQKSTEGILRLGDVGFEMAAGFHLKNILGGGGRISHS